MKTVSIFTEKGGEGKTTLSILFSSWLAYSEGENVAALDFDFPSYYFKQTRAIDERMLSAAIPALEKAAMGNAFYPISRINGPKSGYSEKQLEGLVSIVDGLRKKEDDGYVVMDFPGRFLANDPSYRIMRAGLLDLLVIPVSSDRQSILAAEQLIRALKDPRFFPSDAKKRRQEILVVWNKVNRNEFRSKTDCYEADEESLRNLGVKVSSTRIRDIITARRDSNTSSFIRSTVCWPAVNVRKAAPYLPDLFREMKDMADAVK